MSPRRLLQAFAIVALAASGGFVAYRWRTRSRPNSPARVPHRVAAPRSAPRTLVASPVAPPPLDAPPIPGPPRMFRLDPRHTGRSGFLLPRHPRILARFETGARISAQPVVGIDGRILVGSHDGVLYAVQPEGARVAWRFAASDRVYTTPFVRDDGRVFFGSDADRFFSITARGALEGALATDDDADTSAVPAPDGTLRFASGRVLYSLDGELTVRWRLEFGGKVFSSPAMLADGTAIIGSQDDGIYAIDTTGAMRWHVATGGDVDATPAVDDRGVVYVGSDDGIVYALQSADGAVRWRRDLGGYVRAGVALGLDGSVVVGTFGPRVRIVSLDRDTGAVRWSIPIAGPPTRDYGIASAAIVDREGRYAIGAPDDALRIIARDGSVESRVAMPSDVDSPPVLIRDGVIAVGCDDGGLFLLGDAPVTIPTDAGAR